MSYTEGGKVWKVNGGSAICHLYRECVALNKEATLWKTGVIQVSFSPETAHVKCFLCERRLANDKSLSAR